jgi:hypothetical protein
MMGVSVFLRTRSLVFLLVFPLSHGLGAAEKENDEEE